MLRVRLYRQVPTLDGFMAEITLLDIPLLTSMWKDKDDKALARLEQAVQPRATGVVDPIDEVRRARD